MITASRTNNLDTVRPPLEFGVRIDVSAPSPTLTRLGDAVGMTVNTGVTPHTSDFSSYTPWGGMRRVYLTPVGTIWSDIDDLDDGGTRMALSAAAVPLVMVEVPKFWVKITSPDSSATTTDYYISPYPRKGYRLHPAFNRYGSVVDHIYIGAFEGNVASTFLWSQPNITPTTSTTLTAFRVASGIDAVPAAGYGWMLLEWTALSAIQLLYMVEYANLDSQSNIGAGIVSTAKQKTGYTSLDGPSGCSDLGNGSGKVVIPATADYAVSYRGIENLWGNTSTLIDGIYAAPTSGNLWFSLGNVFDSDAGTGYLKADISAPLSSGYIKRITRMPGTFAEAAQLFPYTVSGGSSSTYMCDYYTTATFTTNNSYMTSGGNYGSGAYAGIFCSQLITTLANTSAATIGARLLFIPYDYRNLTRY